VANLHRGDGESACAVWKGHRSREAGRASHRQQCHGHPSFGFFNELLEVGVNGDQAQTSPYELVRAVVAEVIDMDRALDHIDRPSFLLSASNAYAVYVGGESMAPRFRSGEIVYVDPAVPIRSGGDVVVQMSDKNKLTAIVKEYSHSDDYQIYLKEFTSREQVPIEKFRVTSIHLIRGMYIT